MTCSFEALMNEVKKKFKMSHQRIKILEYLCSNLDHPTVNQIYEALKKDMPTLSKTTIYSFLDALASEGLVRAIDLEENEMRYDIIRRPHGHFKCKSCGTIYNFTVDFEQLGKDDLSGYQVDSRDVYFKGICPTCLSNINNEK